MNTTDNTSRHTFEESHNHWQGKDYFAWAKAPGINPMKVVAVVAGFAIFPPLGLAALGYFIWKSRQSGWSHDRAAFAGGHGGHGHHRCGGGMGRRGRWTGNAAFDEHQAEVIETLRAERQAFWAYRQEQRRKRDQETYDSFRAANVPAPEAPKAE
jgi:hypothetical protein